MLKISFIIHGKFSRQRLLIKNIARVFGSDYVPSCLFTERPFHATELAKNEAAIGANYVIAVGGDGTLNEIVNGILQSGKKDVCLGLLPCGTGNDFAKTVGLKNSLDELKRLIESNSIKQLDAGTIEFVSIDGLPSTRYFINIADVGMGGYIAQKINRYSKWMGATLTFQRAIVSAFLTYKKKDVVVQSADFEYQGKIMSLIVANGKYFGSGLGVAPEAKPDDGIFSVVMAADISLWDYIKNLPKVRRCEKVEHREMKYGTATEITIRSVHEPLPIDMDGEFIGYTPMRVTNLPAALKFLRG